MDHSSDRTATAVADPRDVRPAHPRPWHSRPWLGDLAVALLFTLVHGVTTVLSLVATEGASVFLDATAYQVGLAAVLLRRLHPVLTLGIGLVATLVMVPLTGGDLLVVVAVALYTLAVHRSAAAAWRGLALSAVVVVTLTGLGALGVLDTSGLLTVAPDPTLEGAGYDLGAGLVLVLGLVVVTLVGTNVGARRRSVQALVDRAADLERERDQRARLAVAEERSRIAREMHDVVAHSLSIMVALSDGASETDDVGRARAASAQAAETGREALVQMRQALRVLDPDDSGERRPTPGLGELPALVAELRAVGLPVAATWEPGLVLPPTLGLTVYRLVQESLTNVLRHSRQPSRVQVLVVAVDRRLEVEVTDDGVGPGGPAAAGPGPGSGAGAGADAGAGSGAGLGAGAGTGAVSGAWVGAGAAPGAGASAGPGEGAGAAPGAWAGAGAASGAGAPVGPGAGAGTGAGAGGAGAGAVFPGGSGGVDGDRMGPGRGLLGMRERVAAVGGVLDVGPRDGGGWRVRAVLPLPEPHLDPVTAGVGVGA